MKKTLKTDFAALQIGQIITISQKLIDNPSSMIFEAVVKYQNRAI